MHKALREVLGSHVAQKGSLVDPDKARFDFSHNAPLTAEEIAKVEAIVNAELKRGLSGLATIGATAPFVGLFGTTVGIINAFKGMSSEKTAGLSAVAGGISEALVTTAFGLFVAVPAVWAYNWFTNKVEAFGIEMTNSSSELIDYFIKQHGVRK